MASTSCVNDLDREPFYEATSANVYRDFANYKPILAKLYAGFALTGQQGPAGRPDVGGIDEGASNYVRTYWMLQQVPTDEAVIAWNDPGLPALNTLTWSSNNDVTTAMYYRIFYQITLANEFIREMADDKLNDRGITGANLEEAKKFRAEARFLRALSYWHALDLYGSVPFVTEDNLIGKFFPEQISRADLFTYVREELEQIEDELVAPRQNEYARADQAAAWTLMAKLFLNAEVYTGEQRYTEAITYATKVINAGYTLEQDYDHLFMANNHTSNEIIFPIAFDGLRTQSYGGTTFLTHAAVGGNMSASAFGIDSGWGGIRSTPSIYDLFSSVALESDTRANFHTGGQEKQVNSIATFTDGYPITKWKNINPVTNQPGSNLTFVDTDFPMFRLADVYLIYAEAVLRGGTGGDASLALQYVNALRTRAYTKSTTSNGNITASQLTLNFILDERARELNWEGHRRTDLIRFNRFTGDSYLWAWKGGMMEGTSVPDFRRLYPIPANDLVANPNLTPTPGY